jgi:hypothetical protein
MKPVFKCDYCAFMGTAEEVQDHESKCCDNYDRRSCYTCKHKGYKTMKQWECDIGKEIPEGKIFEFCDGYERGEKDGEIFSDIFGSLFRGV